jgi:hypothetical protein
MLKKSVMKSESGTKSEWILYEQVVYKAQVVSVAEAQPQPVTRRATCDGEYLLRVAAYTYIYIYIYIIFIYFHMFFTHFYIIAHIVVYICM